MLILWSSKVLMNTKSMGHMVHGKLELYGPWTLYSWVLLMTRVWGKVRSASWGTCLVYSDIDNWVFILQVPIRLPSPHPPKRKKCELYDGAKVFDEIDFTAVQVSNEIHIIMKRKLLIRLTDIICWVSWTPCK